MAPRSRKRDLQQTGTESENSDMSEMEKFALLLEQRDKVQAESQQRLVQVQTEGTKNLAEVAGFLSKVHGAQQDAHDVLGAMEKALVDHDNTLRRHIDASKQVNKEQERNQGRLETTLSTSCQGCQHLQESTSQSIVAAIEKVESAITAQNTETQRLVEKQVGLGKILGAIITVSGALGVLIGAILAIMKIMN